MKKAVFITIINISFFTESFGQVNWGYKAGLNLSTVYNSSYNNFTSKLNFNTGALTKLKLNKNCFINIEYLLSHKGFSSILIPNGTTSNSFSYLTLPILFEYQISDKVSFHLGPELNYLIGAKIKTNNAEFSVIDKYKKIDLCLAGGLRYNFTKKIALETRYTIGQSQLNLRPEIFGYNYNRTFQLNLIYWFK